MEHEYIKKNTLSSRLNQSYPAAICYEVSLNPPQKVRREEIEVVIMAVASWKEEVGTDSDDSKNLFISMGRTIEKTPTERGIKK